MLKGFLLLKEELLVSLLFFLVKLTELTVEVSLSLNHSLHEAETVRETHRSEKLMRGSAFKEKLNVLTHALSSHELEQGLEGVLGPKEAETFPEVLEHVLLVLL